MHGLWDYYGVLGTGYNVVCFITVVFGNLSLLQEETCKVRYENNQTYDHRCQGTYQYGSGSDVFYLSGKRMALG